MDLKMSNIYLGFIYYYFKDSDNVIQLSRNAKDQKGEKEKRNEDYLRIL